MFRKKRSAEDFAEEIRAHLELEAAELRAEGRTDEEAWRGAKVEFGSIPAVQERFYEKTHVAWLENLLRDLRIALRSLGKNRRFAVLAILALGLGIGAATVIFSAIYGVILNTFPFRDPDQVTSFGIQGLQGEHAGIRESLTLPEFLAFREQSHAFSDISAEYGGFGSTPVQYTAGEGAFEFSADYMSVNSFGFFGVKPVVGRLPSEADMRANAPPVFMMSYKLWRDQFRGDPSVVGKSFMLSGVSRVLVGVMPPRFRWGWAELWVPFPVDRAAIDADPALARQWVWCVGRLKPGVTLEGAESDLDVVAHRLAKENPELYPKRFRMEATRLSDRVVGPFKGLVYPLLGAVLMLLLIACSNVANLILTRATARETEMMVRAAIGASRARIVQQFMLESFVLAAAGCLFGCALAFLGIRAIVPLIPYNAFPQEAVITLKPMVLACSLGLTLLSTLACCAVPAWRVLRGNLQSHLIGANKGSASQAGHGKMRAGLIVTEVALSMMLLVGTGLMARTFLALTHVDLGFDPDHVLVAHLSIPDSAFQDPARRKEFVRDLLDRLNRVPGVDAAAEGLGTPPNVAVASDVTVPGAVPSGRSSTALDLVSEGYFRTLNFQLQQGRVFTQADVDEERHVVVVNRAFMKRFSGDQELLGRRIQFGVNFSPPGMHSAPDSSFEIVGVVLDEKNDGLTNQAQAEAFLPYTVLESGDRGLLLHTAVDPASLVPTIRHVLWTMNPHVALGDTGSLRSILERDTFANPRFESLVMGAFALTGTLLVVIGIYSMMAYTVSLRRHEIGVRMALGARPGDILRMIFGAGLTLILIGVAVGLGGSAMLTRYLRHQVWGVSLMDPWTYCVVSLVVVAAGLASCLSPARRAAQVDPAATLRSD